ncbi:asparagine synthase-related protein [Niveispirillum sp. SYP-B3756]|uniref:asparagine synthetase B family protein n=1 Tax=Niveispirillum sp. SYP-B3756 TaxID=2662178 RepID=UPI001563D50B|nr:asparagine synthase-related protein [Niveispirillum sp. SYP-B3756]
MRLICGFLHLDGRSAEPGRLAAMVAAMTEPGLTPAVACFTEGPVALAMLDFAPAAAASQVVQSMTTLLRGASGLVLAADCRLYEGKDGRADEAAVLETLESRGGDGADGGLRGIFGDFALAAWNPRDQTLLCARDGMGIRPLFIHDQPDRVFAFASLPRGLTASGFVARELDQAALISTLLVRATPNNRSVLRGIERLGPGTWLRLSARRRESGVHWRLDPATAGRNRCRPQEAAEEMAALVTQAVRARLPATGPVATHLSGGLDSPSISVLAARALRATGRPLLAYSFLPTPRGDYAPDGEGPLVQTVLDQEPDIVSIPVRIGSSLDYLMPRMDCDQPMPFDPADPDAWICMDAATRGAQVLLSGWGGDEGASFNGRGAMAEALLAGHWGRFVREIRACAVSRDSSVTKVLLGEVRNYLLPEAVQTVIQRLRGGMPDSAPMILTELLRSEALRSVLPPKPAMRSNAVANHLTLLTGPILTRRPEHWALTSARTGIAAAFPLLDRRVIEFALTLPSQHFLRDGVSRRLYRDAMIGILPNSILENRSKEAPFSETPLVVALQRDALLRQLPDLRGHPRVNALFDLDALERRLRALPPSAEALRRASELGDSPALNKLAMMLPRILRFIAYVRQHH